MVDSQLLSRLLEPQLVADRQGIFVSNQRAGDETPWDDLGTSAPLDAAISAADEAAERQKSAKQIEQIKRLVTDSAVLLDVGCGYGRVAKYLLPVQRLRAYVGVDSSYAMLGLFKKRYDASKDEQQTPLVLIESDIANMPLKPSSVDVAVTSAVFLHNHKSIVRVAMREIERVLKPGGTLIIFSSFPRRATAMGLQGTAYQALLNLTGRAMKNGPVRYYSRREVADLLRGFSDVRIIPTGFAVFPKSIIGLRGPPERLFRTALSNPLNALFERILPRSTRPAFSRHYDVIARK